MSIWARDDARPPLLFPHPSRPSPRPGERHSLALADDGRVFYWGERCSAAEAPAAASAPQAQEQVGAGGAGGARLQRASDGDDRGIDGDLTGVTPVTCVAGPGTAAPERVSQVAAGGRHSLALTASGAVLAWGSNLQVGRPPRPCAFASRPWVCGPRGPLTPSPKLKPQASVRLSQRHPPLRPQP